MSFLQTNVRTLASTPYAPSLMLQVAGRGYAEVLRTLIRRSPAELGRARAAVEGAGLRFKVLDEKIETESGHVSVSTMHLAKGLEFRAVVVMACDDEVIPSQDRIERVADESDLVEVYETERHLLYVACTRARDHLFVTSGDLPSEFLDDLRL
jgi:superfamily I DNA/RNA helicase